VFIIKEILIQLIVAFLLHEIGYWTLGRKDVFGRISISHLITGMILVFFIVIFMVMIYSSYLTIIKII